MNPFIDPLRLYLLAGLVAHKAVWEILKRRAGIRSRRQFKPIKVVKVAALGFFIAQVFFPALFPIAGDPAILRAAGLLLFTAGLVVAIAARLELGQNWSDIESATILPGQSLVASGLYRHIRHPIYTGDILLVAGFELALNCWLVLLVIPLIFFVRKKADQEEGLLKENLPGYAGYLKSSGRFIPRYAAVGCAGLAIAFCVQLYLVYGLYGGNWSALFMHGSRFRFPPVVAAEKPYIFPGSAGYDGQFYHSMAHDPWMQGRTKRFMDDPKLRYPRILVPALAWLLAFGSDRWIDSALLAVSLMPFFLGPWWLGRLLAAEKRSRWWGLTFLAVPSAFISMERLCVDAWLLALCCGFLLYTREERALPRFAVLVLAPLARETGVLLIGAAGLSELLRKRIPAALIAGVAILPAALWTFYVRANTRAAFTHIGLPPSGNALVDRFFEIPNYGNLPPAIASAAVALDYLSLCGVVLAILASVFLLRNPRQPAHILAAAFASLPVVVGGVIGWYEPFGFPRALSPLYLSLLVAALLSRRSYLALPLAMALPRLFFQLAPLLPGVRRLIP